MPASNDTKSTTLLIVATTFLLVVAFIVGYSSGYSGAESNLVSLDNSDEVSKLEDTVAALQESKKNTESRILKITEENREHIHKEMVYREALAYEKQLVEFGKEKIARLEEQLEYAKQDIVRAKRRCQ